MVDIFEEVAEDLRSDRLGALARRYLPWVIGGLLLALVVALAVWGYTSYQEKNVQAASQSYAAGLDQIDKGDLDAAYARFGEAASKSAPAYKALALMEQGGVRMTQKRVPEAVQLFDQAAQASSDPLIQDSARLKSAFALLDTAPLVEIEARLKPLADPKRPYHALAREALAMAKLNAGRPQDALSDFEVLTLMADAPNDVRQRAQTAIILIKGGTAGGLPAIVKLAQTLPPLPPPPAQPAQGAPTQGAPAQGAPSDQPPPTQGPAQ